MFNVFFSPCWNCSKCGIGLYEAKKCSSYKDTVCDECTAYIGKVTIFIKNDFIKKCSYIFLK